MTYRLWLVSPQYGRTWQATYVDPDEKKLGTAIAKYLTRGLSFAYPEGVEVERRER